MDDVNWVLWKKCKKCENWYCTFAFGSRTSTRTKEKFRGINNSTASTSYVHARNVQDLTLLLIWRHSFASLTKTNRRDISQWTKNCDCMSCRNALRRSTRSKSRTCTLDVVPWMITSSFKYGYGSAFELFPRKQRKENCRIKNKLVAPQANLGTRKLLRVYVVFNGRKSEVIQ